MLEVGVGAGTDFVKWVRHGAVASGIDLTEQSVALTRERLALEGLEADVRVADVEDLPFEDNTFDIVYAYGVLHHSPDTPRAVREVYRVLRHGGAARVMIYHYPSWVCFMLWGVHSLAGGRPWQSPRRAVLEHLESPGTKVYTVAEARRLFGAFGQVQVRTQLSHADILLMPPSARYKARWHRELVWRLYPRAVVRAAGDRLGTALFVEAVK